MEFILKRCGVVIMKRGKLVAFPDGGLMKSLDKDGCKYFLWVDKHNVSAKWDLAW